MAAASTVLAGHTVGTAQAQPSNAGHTAALVRLSAEANGALMRGDIHTYRSLMTYSDDFTFMSPFGGAPRRRNDLTEERMEAMGRYFSNGVFAQDLIEAYSTDDLIVLVLVERQNVEVGGLAAQDWPLRVTLVYRRGAAGWELAHRHADPLLHGISLQRAASLARGERGG